MIKVIIQGENGKCKKVDMYGHMIFKKTFPELEVSITRQLSKYNVMEVSPKKMASENNYIVYVVSCKGIKICAHFSPRSVITIAYGIIKGAENELLQLIDRKYSKIEFEN